MSLRCRVVLKWWKKWSGWIYFGHFCSVTRLQNGLVSSHLDRNVLICHANRTNILHHDSDMSVNFWATLQKPCQYNLLKDIKKWFTNANTFCVSYVFVLLDWELHHLNYVYQFYHVSFDDSFVYIYKKEWIHYKKMIFYFWLKV